MKCLSGLIGDFIYIDAFLANGSAVGVDMNLVNNGLVGIANYVVFSLALNVCSFVST